MKEFIFVIIIIILLFINQWISGYQRLDRFRVMNESCGGRSATYDWENDDIICR